MNPASKTRTAIPLLGLAATMLLGLACGDDSGGADTPDGGFAASSKFEAKCATPRSGIDPGTGSPFPDQQGTLDDEKQWLRSWTHELYLWYKEVPDPDPGTFSTAVAYFDVLKTPALNPSGRPKDPPGFHFIFDTAAWEALSQSGVEAGYGVQWAILARSPPRKAVAAFNQPGSPAAAASITRGASVITVDGVDFVNGADANTINAGLFPEAAGETHTFSILDLGATTPRTVTLTSANVTSSPVQNVTTITTPTGAVGYMLFNDHNAVAEAALSAAVTQLKNAGVTDLVLDLRYNGGGLIYIASELAYMIAGPAATSGKTFERIAFNDQHPTRDPVTGQPLTPMPFFNATSSGPLPSLGLSRVFVLTSAGTCSASESIMNGLRGVDVEVIQIGKTTCGKPYGFYPFDNCGTTYFSIQFQGFNEKGFGDYPDGFVPAGTGPAGLPGCDVADDFTHALGDANEARLATALAYRTSQTCQIPVALQKLGGASPLSAIDGEIVKSPWHMNRQYPRNRR